MHSQAEPWNESEASISNALRDIACNVIQEINVYIRFVGWATGYNLLALISLLFNH